LEFGVQGLFLSKLPLFVLLRLSETSSSNDCIASAAIPYSVLKGLLQSNHLSSSSSLLLSSLELSDTKVYEPSIQSLIGVRRLTDYSQADKLGVRYNLINVEAKASQGAPNQRDQTRE
jgi:hypothetical protein